MNAKVEKGMFLSKMKCQQVESLYALTTVPKALDKRGVVNVSVAVAVRKRVGV